MLCPTTREATNIKSTFICFVLLRFCFPVLAVRYYNLRHHPHRRATFDLLQYPNYIYLRYKVPLLSYIFSQDFRHPKASVISSEGLFHFLFKGQGLVMYYLCVFWNVANQTAIAITHSFQQSISHSFQVTRKRKDVSIAVKFLHLLSIHITRENYSFVSLC